MLTSLHLHDQGCQNKPATGVFLRLFWILCRLLRILAGQFWAWYWRNKNGNNCLLLGWNLLLKNLLTTLHDKSREVCIILATSHCQSKATVTEHKTVKWHIMYRLIPKPPISPPPTGQTSGQKFFGQIARCVASLAQGQMPHPLELQRGSNPPPSRENRIPYLWK